MHTRVRMIAGSFLGKHLLLRWQDGARWFWETLVNTDLANNTFGWQWVDGCGTAAVPYFRVFNPVRQGERFDGQGTYVRRWVPELRRIKDRWVHQPWKAPSILPAGDSVGNRYPKPIVDHHFARQRVLDALGSLNA